MTPPKRRAQIHQSTVNQMGFCQVQYEFSAIKGIKRPPGFALISGSGTHKAAEANLSNKVIHQELLPEDEVTDRAVEYVEDAVDEAGGLSQIDLEADEEEIGAERAFGEAKDKASRLARVHHRELAPRIQPARWVGSQGEALSVERRFSIDLDAFLRDRARALHAEARLLPKDSYERKVKESTARALNVTSRIGLDFSGSQDVVEEFELEGRPYFGIRDLKTKRSSPTETAADESDQLSSYFLASWVVDGKKADYVTLDCLVDLKRGPKTVVRVSTRSEHDMDVFLNRVVATIHAIRSGVFVPIPQTDWRCSEKWCGYFSICPYARRPHTITVPPQLVKIATGE